MRRNEVEDRGIMNDDYKTLWSKHVFTAEYRRCRPGRAWNEFFCIGQRVLDLTQSAMLVSADVLYIPHGLPTSTEHIHSP
jgi:hypothetical protein